MSEVLFLSEHITLGQKVRILRISKRWTQDDLALEAGVTQAQVSAVERDLKVWGKAKEKILAAVGLGNA